MSKEFFKISYTKVILQEWKKQGTAHWKEEIEQQTKGGGGEGRDLKEENWNRDAG